MKPTPKAPGIEKLLSTLSGDTRQAAVEQKRCIKEPIGCGKPIMGFHNPLAAREWQQSGLCQACQDSFFGE